MGPTTLFTHLKIISLQCFQFQFSVSAKIISIQTHPKKMDYLHAAVSDALRLYPSVSVDHKEVITLKKTKLNLLMKSFFFFFLNLYNWTVTTKTMNLNLECYGYTRGTN